MKELKRSRTNRMVAGVCGGIGEYLGIDPNVIRLIWVVVTVFTVGTGVLAYLLAWLIIPEEAPPATETEPFGTTASSGMPAGAGATIEIDPDLNR
jgi:phage shock protein C